MKKEHQIIMLPSEKQQENVLCIAHGQLFFSEGLITPGGDIMPQHLYILSDEEIKQGDWFVNLGSGGHPKVAIYQANSENSKAINEFKFPEIKKIIGTTNSELHLNKIVEEDMHMYKEPLPQISQDLIKSYVEKPFDKVVVEYDRYINVPEGVTVRFNDELPKALGGCEGCSGTVIWGVKDTPIFISSCLKVSFVNNYGVKTEKYANAAHWSDSLKEFYYDTPKLNPDGILAVSLVEEKMYSRDEAIENVYELLAERLGLKELETPRNRWVNKEGQHFTLTQYGFKWIKENL